MFKVVTILFGSVWILAVVNGIWAGITNTTSAFETSFDLMLISTVVWLLLGLLTKHIKVKL